VLRSGCQRARSKGQAFGLANRPPSYSAKRGAADRGANVGLPELLPASATHEGLHFLKANGAIVVGVHGFEDPLVSRLPLLQ
jgi:hypothetical protein